MLSPACQTPTGPSDRFKLLGDDAVTYKRVVTLVEEWDGSIAEWVAVRRTPVLELSDPDPEQPSVGTTAENERAEAAKARVAERAVIRKERADAAAMMPLRDRLAIRQSFQRSFS